MNILHYSKNNKCIDCNKLITNNAIRCCHCSKKHHWTKEEYQKYFIGDIAPNYKHGKYIENNCVDCGKKINGLYERCKSCSKKGKLSNRWLGGKPNCIDCGKQLYHYGERCKNCYKLYYRGERHHCWIEGISHKPYPKKFNQKLKLEIRTRDNFECQYCGLKEKDHKFKYKAVLCIHHIDYNKLNCDTFNLITVCFDCNTKANGNRDYWFAYYTYLIEEKFNVKN